MYNIYHNIDYLLPYNRITVHKSWDGKSKKKSFENK